MNPLQILQLVVGLILVFFVPGYFISLAIFRKKELDLIERVCVSAGLSVAVVPLLIFYLNKFFKVPIAWYTDLIIIFSISLVAFFFYKKEGLSKRKRKRRKYSRKKSK